MSLRTPHGIRAPSMSRWSQEFYMNPSIYQWTGRLEMEIAAC
jgi:hypothetical protein